MQHRACVGGAYFPQPVHAEAAAEQEPEGLAFLQAVACGAAAIPGTVCA